MLQPEKPPESKIGEQLTDLAIQRLLDGLENGGGQSEESALPLWLRGVIPVAKALGQGAMAALAERFLGAPMEEEEIIEPEPAPQPVSPLQRPAIAANSETPASPNPPIPPARKPLSAEQALQIVFRDLAQNVPVARSANIIKQLLQNPTYGGLMESWMNATPRELMEGLSQFPDYAPLMQLLHTEEWLSQLIEAVTGQPPRTDDEAETEADGDAEKKVFDKAA